MTTENEDYLLDENEKLRAEITHLHARLSHARETVEMQDDIIHKAGKIAQVIPYLCESLQEPSNELLQASMQLQTFLVQRKL